MHKTTEKNELYSDLAWVYEAVADDRNFLLEVEKLALPCGTPAKPILELFAGPAYHSIAIQSQENSQTVVAIDNSPEMEKCARSRGFNGRYEVCDVNVGVGRYEQCSAVLIPRYSIVFPVSIR